MLAGLAPPLQEVDHVAQHVRDTMDFGRSQSMYRLFDYILERTLKGEIIKEVDIATEVLGKSGPELLIDASARVYIHRLRKKLEEFYSGPGASDPQRLDLPKGEYRFRVSAPKAAKAIETEAASPSETYPSPRKRSIGLTMAVPLLALTLGIGIGAWSMRGSDFTTEQTAVRKSSLWSPIFDGSRPLILVTGDYYIFGERDAPGAEPARLVREFSINSREELDEVMMFDPKLRDRYVDLDLFYLPVSTASALRSIGAVVGSARNSQVVTASALSPGQLKSNDLVYVGLLSGLGLLQQAVFSNSRFGFGGSFDEIIDTKTGKIYVSEPPRDAQTPRRNFAYVASLPGPNGNRILIVAGTRDAGLLEAVAMATSKDGVDQLAALSKGGYFEALYAVDGMGTENLKGTLIAAEARSAKGIWEAMTTSPQLNDAP